MTERKVSELAGLYEHDVVVTERSGTYRAVRGRTAQVIEEDSDLSTVLQAAADDAGSGTVLLKSADYGSLSSSVTGSALFVLAGPDVSLSGTDNLPAVTDHTSGVRHEASAVVFKDGSDTVAVDAQGVEIDRDTDAMVVLQSAVDNLSDGDTIYVQPSSSTYSGSTELEIDKALTIRGSIDGGNRENLSNMSGTRLEQTGENNDCINITVNNQPVNLFDLGIQFGSDVSQTGHGVNCVPPNDSDESNKKDGIVNSYWRQLYVSGHSTDRYAFRVINPMHNEWHSLRSATGDGGGLQLIADHDSTNFGNTQIYDFWASPADDSGVHGIELKADNTTLNLIDFYGPQMNIGSGSVKHISIVEQNGGSVKDCAFFATDFEGSSGGGVDVTSANSFVIIPMFKGSVWDGTGVRFLEFDDTKLDGNLIRTDTYEGTQVTITDSVGGDVQIRVRNRNSENRVEDEQGGTNFTHHDKANGVDRWKSKGDGGMFLQEQDLSSLSLGSGDDKDVYLHDGSSSINADGGTTSQAGYYAWDNPSSEFQSIVQF